MGTRRTHEDFSREERASTSSDRAFGFTVGSIVVLLAFLPLLYPPRGQIWWWLLGLGALLIVLAAFWTAPLRPLNKAWLKFGLLLFRIVNPVVLFILFYGCITPIGWLMRATGKFPLRLKLDRSAKSYWIVRETLPGRMHAVAASGADHYSFKCCKDGLALHGDRLRVFVGGILAHRRRFPTG